MNEEEKQVIEKVKWLFKNANPFAVPPYIYFSLETIVNLIERQQREIKGNNETIDSLKRDIGEYVLEKEKQDKMIDLMAKSMKENLCDADKMYICNGFTYEIKTCACMNENENCIQKIKEQFRKKVENE